MLPRGTEVALHGTPAGGLVHGGGHPLAPQIELFREFSSGLHHEKCPNVSLSFCDGLDDEELVRQIEEEFPGWTLIRPGYGYPTKIVLCDNSLGTCPTADDAEAAEHMCDGLLTHHGGQIIWIALGWITKWVPPHDLERKELAKVLAHSRHNIGTTERTMLKTILRSSNAISLIHQLSSAPKGEGIPTFFEVQGLSENSRMVIDYLARNPSMTDRLAEVMGTGVDEGQWEDLAERVLR
ncbi:hypothetical protein ACFQ78_33815 [Streptomyces sp. NPDC056519]|uniref:hypothetical protein n=1 Tax=Streptomyces sp. NPDC056519 TaxID=3345849 RepID=UPI0036B1F1AC